MKLTTWSRHLPWSIVVAAILLVGLGWLAIARVEELTEGSGRFLHQQMAYSVLALAAMLLLSIPNYQAICRFSHVLFLVAIAFNILVAVWIHTDIRKRGEGSGIFIALAVLAGIPAAIIYALVRIGDNIARQIGGAKSRVGDIGVFDGAVAAHIGF